MRLSNTIESLTYAIERDCHEAVLVLLSCETCFTATVLTAGMWTDDEFYDYVWRATAQVVQRVVT